jgi:Bacteriophage probable baseplate hub protein
VTDFLVPEFDVIVNGTAIPAEVKHHVLEISVVSETDFAGRLTLTLANDFPDLRFTHGDDDALFGVGQKLVVRLGYGDERENVFEGDVTAVGATFPDDGAPTLAVEAQTPHHRLRGDVRTRTFTDVKDSEAASSVLRASGASFEVETTSTVHTYLIQYNETDLAFLARRAHALRFVLVHEDGKLKFRSPNESESAPYRLVWGNPTQAAADDTTFPLRRFGPTLQPLRPVTEVVVRGLNPLTREPIVERVISAATSTGGARTGVAARKPAFGGRVEDIVNVPVSSVDEARALARAAFDRLAMEYVTATGLVPGLPGLRAGRSVEVSGVGVYEGVYWLTRTTHRFSGRGYETAFTARSDSLG